MRIAFSGYVISDDKELLNIEKIKSMLAGSYWANRRSGQQIEKSIDNSLCYGVYHGSKQIGFARVVTDYATMYWLCDVIIDEEYRGMGIGKKLVECLASSEELDGLMGILGTKDAHGLYAQCGYETIQDRFMRRSP
jgi:GNAT superfamily N-acetyltransferase